MTALQQQGAAAKKASRILATAGTAKKNEALEAIAKILTERQEEWLSANAEDIAAAKENGMRPAMLDRLTLTPDRVALAISSGDHKALTAANGVGPKLAQRITLELKDKVGKGLVEGVQLSDVTAAAVAGAAPQAIAALVSLGYSQSEAAAVIARLDTSLPVEELIKLALRSMAGGR